MKPLEALELTVEHRKALWLEHCRFVLDRVLIPLCEQQLVRTPVPCQRALVLIENRINQQWLFTVLNSWLMAPIDMEFWLIADQASASQARQLLNQHAPGLAGQVLAVDELLAGTQLSDHGSFNAMLKQSSFWNQLPHEQILIIQTDALLARPLDPFFFQFPYLGAPFLPRQHSEYFEMRQENGRINSFFKTDTPIHGSPDQDVYPHLHGNGGLSIRQRSVMKTVCERWGAKSPIEEQEDVFFSRHVARIAAMPPLEIAQAFAMETTYNPAAIGSHACWKFLSSADLADHFSQHLRAAWSMAQARRQAAS